MHERSLAWAEGPRLGFEPNTHIWESDKEVSAMLDERSFGYSR